MEYVPAWDANMAAPAGGFTAGALLVFVAYLGKMYKPMKDLSKMTDTLSKAAVGFERIGECVLRGDTLLGRAVAFSVFLAQVIDDAVTAHDALLDRARRALARPCGLDICIVDGAERGAADRQHAPGRIGSDAETVKVLGRSAARQRHEPSEHPCTRADVQPAHRSAASFEGGDRREHRREEQHRKQGLPR